MPSLRPMMPFTFFELLELDLDVHACGQVEAHQLVDGLRGRRVDVDEALVRAHLEVLTGVLVLERTTEDRVAVVLGRQGHRPGDSCTGPLRRLDDLRRRSVELLMVVGLQADADLGLSHVLGRASEPAAYLITSVTTPAPTVRPPSRTAKRRP